MSEEESFNPRKHLMQLKSREGDKDYLPVQWRLVWFREQCPQGIIETEMVHLDLTQAVTKEVPVWNSEKRRSDKVLKEAPGIALFRAKVSDGRGGVATGYGSESALDFGDFIEKAETKAIGRALAALGYGTQFAPELEEGVRIVDTPVDRAPANGNGSSHANSSNGNAASTVTEQQVASIRKLCHHLGKNEPDNVTSISFATAKQLIQKLTQEYKEASNKKTEPEPASPALIAEAKKLYAQVGRTWDPEIEKKSAKVVRTLMEQASGMHREQINTKNGHPEDLPDVKALRERCEQLGLKWEVVQVTAIKANILDNSHTFDQRERIHRFLNNVAEQQARQKVAS